MQWLYNLLNYNKAKSKNIQQSNENNSYNFVLNNNRDGTYECYLRLVHDYRNQSRTYYS